MHKDIIVNLKTMDDVYKLQDELDLLLKSLYQSTNKYNEVLESETRNWVSQIIKDEITKQKLTPKDFLESVSSQLESFTKIDLVIAFEPSRSTIDSVSSWVKKNLGENVMINFICDPGVFAGTIISYNGKYLDMSLANKFNEAVNALIAKKPQGTGTPAHDTI